MTPNPVMPGPARKLRQETEALVAEAIHWIVRHRREQPSLGELAAHLGYSEAHVQKTFQRYAGVTPKQFLKHLTREAALQRLRAGHTVLETAMDVGLSGPGRLHDLLVTTEAVTPGEARRRGRGLVMHLGAGDTPFGPALLAWTTRGITFLAFTRDSGEAAAMDEFRQQWPDAETERNDREAARLLETVFAESRSTPLPVWLRGSPFQLKVWAALLEIPGGTHWSYGELARALGLEGAARAVGSAVGRNPVAWIIPCHRVIAASGGPGGYRWGLDTKHAMIGLEAGRRSGPGQGDQHR